MSEDYVERATTFDGSEAPSGKRLDESESYQEHYERLSVWNSLDFNGKWRDENRQTARNSAAIVDAVAGQLQLTDYQTERAKAIFSELPDNYNQARSTTLLALCVCGLAGREDGRQYHPNQIHPAVGESNEFAELAEDADVSYMEFYRVWNTIRREVL